MTMLTPEALESAFSTLDEESFSVDAEAALGLLRSHIAALEAALVERDDLAMERSERENE